jgi:hypothetical protein
MFRVGESGMRVWLVLQFVLVLVLVLVLDAVALL